ncbi:hypothetical protein [Thermotoga sp. KOL6]|uniref:hypothetical protein n=1 Tax=Thermotoga sp. KOL6 TaxID=126741 RepID=UPI000C762EC3|nr:hypothetical protein [Thermotoga sp. KOL6]PLV59025.1 hypothetical protein AS005_04510 [Thermotoga sp. KOL6]
MRKWFIFMLLVIAVLSFSQILNYVPANFKVVRYVKNLSEFYSEIKTLPSGQFLTETLGLEMMIQGILESQLLNQGIEPSDFYDLLSHEFLYVQLDNKNFCLIVGPSKSTKRLKENIKSIVSELFGVGDIIVAEDNDYLFLGTSEAVNSTLKGGGDVPEELKKLDFFGYAKVQVGDYSFTIVNKKEIAGDHLTLETEIVPEDESSKSFLEKLGKSKEVPPDYYVYGELTIIFNTEDYKGLRDIISDVGFSFPSNGSGLPFQPPDMDVEKILDTLSESLDTPMFFSANISGALMDLIAGSTPTNLEIIARAKLKDSKSIVEKVLKEAGIRYEKSGDKFILENNFHLVVSDGAITLKSKTFSPKTLKEHPDGKDVFFLFLDMKTVMEALVGEGEEAYILAKAWYENGRMLLYVNVK